MAAGDGLISMTPTSIAHSGTSATINADGGVDFTAVTELSLNGVFTGDYDNYLIVISCTATSVGAHGEFRLRAAGTDNSTASSYVRQRLNASSTSVSGARATADYGRITSESGTNPNGYTIAIYGPALAQPTAWRLFSASSRDNAYVVDIANTHNQSTSYDGFTWYPDAGSFTGNIHVFGYEE